MIILNVLAPNPRVRLAPKDALIAIPAINAARQDRNRPQSSDAKWGADVPIRLVARQAPGPHKAGETPAPQWFPPMDSLTVTWSRWIFGSMTKKSFPLSRAYRLLETGPVISKMK